MDTQHRLGPRPRSPSYQYQACGFTNYPDHFSLGSECDYSGLVDIYLLWIWWQTIKIFVYQALHIDGHTVILLLGLKGPQNG